MASRNRKVLVTADEALDVAFEVLDGTQTSFEHRVKNMKAEINAYFDALAKTALELRKDNNSLNDAEIISGRYKKEILEIIKKYFPDER